MRPMQKKILKLFCVNDTSVSQGKLITYSAFYNYVLPTNAQIRNE
jgi:hypothetical protein